MGATRPKLVQAEIERAKRKPTDSLDAYDYYLRGISVFNGMTRETNEEALRLFYKAIELDPDFSSAYSLAAWCYSDRKGNGWLTDSAKETAEAARLARLAVELGKDDAIALSYGAWTLGYMARDPDAGVAFVDRALEINPNLAAAWYFSGWLRIWFGKPEVAIQHLARAMRLSPLDPLINAMRAATAHAHFHAGRYDEASSWAEMAVREAPNHMFLRIASASNALAGRVEEAKKLCARLQQLDPALRVSNLKDVLGPYRPQDLAKYEEGLRKAGLPE